MFISSSDMVLRRAGGGMDDDLWVWLARDAKNLRDVFPTVVQRRGNCWSRVPLWVRPVSPVRTDAPSLCQFKIQLTYCTLTSSVRVKYHLLHLCVLQESRALLPRPPGLGRLDDRVGPPAPTPRQSTFLCLVWSYGPTVPRHACTLLLPDGVSRRFSFDHAEYPGHRSHLSPSRDTVSECAVLGPHWFNTAHSVPIFFRCCYRQGFQVDTRMVSPA